MYAGFLACPVATSPCSERSARAGSGHFRRRPDRHLPERVAARVADAGDHLAPAPLHLFARDLRVLDDGVGVTVAPGLPDAGERLAGNAQRVDDDVVDLDVAQAQVDEMSEHLASHVEVTANGGPVA